MVSPGRLNRRLSFIPHSPDRRARHAGRGDRKVAHQASPGRGSHEKEHEQRHEGEGSSAPDPGGGFLEMILESLDLFTDPQSVVSGFNAESIQALRKKGYPYAPMMRCVDTDDLNLSPTDPFYLKVKDDGLAQNKRRLEAIKAQIGELIEPIMKNM